MLSAEPEANGNARDVDVLTCGWTRASSLQRGILVKDEDDWMSLAFTRALDRVCRRR